MAILYNDEGKPITKANPLPVSFEDADINLPPGSVVFPDEMKAQLADETGAAFGTVANPLVARTLGPDGSTIESVERFGLGNSPVSVPSTPLGVERDVTVQHVGRGGRVYAGGATVDTSAQLGPGESIAFRLPGGERTQVFADAFEMVGDTQIQNVVLLPALGLLVGFIGTRAFASGDEGQTWESWGELPHVLGLGITPTMFPLRVYQLVAHRQLSDGQYELFAAVEVDDNPRLNIYRSRDSGRTWTGVHWLHAANTVEATSVASDGQTVLFSTNSISTAGRGILRSSDNGDTWEHTESGSQRRVFHGGQRDVFLAVTAANASSNNVFRSFDAGETWEALTVPLSPASEGRQLLHIEGDTFLYASSRNDRAELHLLEDVLAVDVGDMTATRVYFSTSDVSPWTALVRSGRTIIAANELITLVGPLTPAAGTGESWQNAGLPGVLGIVPQAEGRLVAITNHGVYHGHDDGRTPITVTEAT